MSLCQYFTWRKRELFYLDFIANDGKCVQLNSVYIIVIISHSVIINKKKGKWGTFNNEEKSYQVTKVSLSIKHHKWWTLIGLGSEVSKTTCPSCHQNIFVWSWDWSDVLKQSFAVWCRVALSVIYGRVVSHFQYTVHYVFSEVLCCLCEDSLWHPVRWMSWVGELPTAVTWKIEMTMC